MAENFGGARPKKRSADVQVDMFKAISDDGLIQNDNDINDTFLRNGSSDKSSENVDLEIGIINGDKSLCLNQHAPERGRIRKPKAGMEKDKMKKDLPRELKETNKRQKKVNDVEKLSKVREQEYLTARERWKKSGQALRKFISEKLGFGQEKDKSIKKNEVELSKKLSERNKGESGDLPGHSKIHSSKEIPKNFENIRQKHEKAEMNKFSNMNTADELDKYQDYMNGDAVKGKSIEILRCSELGTSECSFVLSNEIDSSNACAMCHKNCDKSIDFGDKSIDYSQLKTPNGRYLEKSERNSCEVNKQCENVCKSSRGHSEENKVPRSRSFLQYLGLKKGKSVVKNEESLKMKKSKSWDISSSEAVPESSTEFSTTSDWSTDHALTNETSADKSTANEKAGSIIFKSFQKPCSNCSVCHKKKKSKNDSHTLKGKLKNAKGSKSKVQGGGVNSKDMKNGGIANEPKLSEKKWMGLLDDELETSSLSSSSSSEDEYEFVFDEEYGEIVRRQKDSHKLRTTGNRHKRSSNSSQLDSKNRPKSQELSETTSQALSALQYAIPYLPERFRNQIHMSRNPSSDTREVTLSKINSKIANENQRERTLYSKNKKDIQNKRHPPQLNDSQAREGRKKSSESKLSKDFTEGSLDLIDRLEFESTLEDPFNLRGEPDLSLCAGLMDFVREIDIPFIDEDSETNFETNGLIDIKQDLLDRSRNGTKRNTDLRSYGPKHVPSKTVDRLGQSFDRKEESNLWFTKENGYDRAPDLGAEKNMDLEQNVRSHRIRTYDDWSNKNRRSGLSEVYDKDFNEDVKDSREGWFDVKFRSPNSNGSKDWDKVGNEMSGDIHGGARSKGHTGSINTQEVSELDSKLSWRKHVDNSNYSSDDKEQFHDGNVPRSNSPEVMRYNPGLPMTEWEQYNACKLAGKTWDHPEEDNGFWDYINDEHEKDRTKDKSGLPVDEYLATFTRDGTSKESDSEKEALEARSRSNESAVGSQDSRSRTCRLGSTSNDSGSGSQGTRLISCQSGSRSHDSDSISKSSDENLEADDEFECECDHCQLLRQHSYNGNNLDLLPPRLSSSTQTPTDDQEETLSWQWPLQTQDPFDRFDSPVFADAYDFLDSSRDEFDWLIIDSRPLSDMLEDVIQQMLAAQPDLLNEQATPPTPQQVIERLPTLEMTLAHLDQHPSCPICLCTCEIEEVMTLLPCQHLFHPICIQAWLIKSGTCPVCRATLPRR